MKWIISLVTLLGCFFIAANMPGDASFGCFLLSFVATYLVFRYLNNQEKLNARKDQDESVQRFNALSNEQKNCLLGLIAWATKMSISKDNKANAMVMETQKIWIQQVEAEQVACPFLQAALTDILNLHLDQKFFPTVEDVSLWVTIETLLKLKPFPFYEKDFMLQTKLKLIYQDGVIKGGDVDAKQFNKAVEDYRMSGLIKPLLEQIWRGPVPRGAPSPQAEIDPEAEQKKSKRIKRKSPDKGRNCPKCQALVEDDAEFCDQCGGALPRR